MADEDGHSLEVTGGVDVLTEANDRAIDLRIEARRLHVLDNPVGDIQINASLRASGQLRAPRVEGEARIEQGRLEVDQVLERTTKSAYATTSEAEPGSAAPAVPPAAATAAPTGSAFENAVLKIVLTLPDNLVLRGRDMRVANQSMGVGSMNMIVGGSLEINKAAGQNTVVVGAVEVVRGYYEFQGRRFDVSRGSGVRFRGNQPIDPGLNFTATREISGVRTSVDVRGTASRPTLNLSSQPPLDEGDILSLIVFNAPINDLGEGQRTSLAQRAGDMAAGAIAAPIANSVARALNLDQFEIQAASSGSSTPSVTVGNQIGTRLFVGLRQEFGRADASTVSFEYRFFDALRLVTSVAQGTTVTSAGRRPASSGADLIFTIRY
jgi:translocation and assembly module TamB